MKRYKLLRDLPGYAAGEGDFKRDDNGTWTLSGQRVISWKWGMFDEALDQGWFEELPPENTRWQADPLGPSYYYVDDGLDVRYSGNSSLDTAPTEARRDAGNQFRAQYQAAAVAKAIRALLAYVHTPVESTDEKGHDIQPFPLYTDANSFIRLADEARKALQSPIERKEIT